MIYKIILLFTREIKFDKRWRFKGVPIQSYKFMNEATKRET